MKKSIVNDVAFNVYRREMSSFVPFDRKDLEHVGRLLIIIRDGGSGMRAAKEELAKGFMRYMYMKAWRYYSQRGGELGELVLVANLALAEALDSYNDTDAQDLWGHVSNCVWRSLKEFGRRNTGVVYVPRSAEVEYVVGSIDETGEEPMSDAEVRLDRGMDEGKTRALLLGLLTEVLSGIEFRVLVEHFELDGKFHSPVEISRRYLVSEDREKRIVRDAIGKIKESVRSKKIMRLLCNYLTKG